MLFNSAAFAVFLPLIFVVYWSLKGQSRRIALLLGSYVFYSWLDWRCSGLLLLSTVVDYVCALGIDAQQQRRSRRTLIIISVVLNLGLLAAFKYFNFFCDSAAMLLESVGLPVHMPTLQVILPAGISFYTFQTMSYTIDVYRGEKPERSFIDFALFVSCFPQLVAGPIVRASDFLPQLKRDARFEDVDFSSGVYLILRGLFKKMIVADTLSIYVDLVFGAPSEFHGLSAWVALYAYAFQIYMDFSGYTDVAIGVGRLLGIEFTKNFDRPYLATSPSEFWRRWHITLSTWLRDYLYIPLGGSRRGSLLTVRNLFITMLLGGLWHGAAWTFVAWGAYHAILLSLERPFRAVAGERTNDPFPLRVLKTLAMFHLICLGWLLFRAPNWDTVIVLGANLFDFSSPHVRGLRILVLVLLCAAAHALPDAKRLAESFRRLPALGQGAFAAVTMWVLLLTSPGVKPFIYFQF